MYCLKVEPSLLVHFHISFLSQRIDYYTEQEQAMVLSETQETHAHSHGPVDNKGENSQYHYINLTQYTAY